MVFMKLICIFACLSIAYSPVQGKPSLLAEMRKLKDDGKCDRMSRWGFVEEGKVWHDSCPPCDVCGARELGGAFMESQMWCISKTGGNDICRSDCGCPEGQFRFNITRTTNNIEEIVEICISAASCLNAISMAKCPEGQIWDERAPFCTRTCNNTLGLHKNEPCPKLWRPRCICPFNKPIWHENKCIKVEDCPK